MKDYIERAAVIDLITRRYELPELCTHEINSIPAADVDPVRHGRWEEVDWVEPDGHGFGTVRMPKAGLRCSQCSNVFKKELLWKDNYCPNCGALMDEKEDRHD